MNEGWTRIDREPIENRTRNERETNEGWTELERKIYRRNCWADCEAVSLLMIFQELIKVDFGTFLLDDDLYNTLQSIRHIKTLLPNAEHCQTCCLKIISLQPHENQEESNAEKKNKIKFLKPKVMPNMKICRNLGMGQRLTLAQCLWCSKFMIFYAWFYRILMSIRGMINGLPR